MADPHDELARLLEHARSDAPSDQVLGDVRERVLSSLAASAASTAPAAVATVGVRASSLIKLLAGVVGVGVMVAAYFALRPAAPAPVAPQRVEPAPLAPAPPRVETTPPPETPTVTSPGLEPPVLEPAPEPKPKPRRPARIVEQPPAPAPAVEPLAPPAPKSSFAEEVALIKAALAAQREGRAAEAREKLAEHAKRFPEGQLANERKRIEARLGQ